MGTFVLLTTLSPEGAQAIRRNPSQLQLDAVVLEKLGGQVLGQWALLGPYDFLTVIEAADERAAASIAVELAARSSSRVQPMAAIPLDVYLERLSPEDPEP
jgi:uncharacterized protein with GYD domain